MVYRMSDPLLPECAASGQMTASQLHQHYQAGELPVQMLCAEPAFTVVPDTEYRRMQHLATIGATVTIEAYARRVLRSFGTSQPVYDVTDPDDDELPDDTPRHQTIEDLAIATAHLIERGLIFRPWEDRPHLVAFVGRT